MITETFLKDRDSGMNYIISYPDYAKEMIKKKGEHDLPLIIYLHGAGERGGDVSHLYRHAIPKLISEGRNYDAIFLCPQCPKEFIWNNMPERFMALAEKIIVKYKIKRDRIALTGSSMGGCGTLEMGTVYSSFFSAIAPVASEGLLWRCGKLVNTPVYFYHGDKDDSVLYERGKSIYEGVIKAGGKADFTTLPGLGHNDGIDHAYRNTDLIERLIKARRTDFTRVPEICEEWF